ncbi:MAG: HPr family phosphocarrier protein [Azospirillum sp.]|nr:HPr family phosphocarrier protein [Azospirillum sp.]
MDSVNHKCPGAEAVETAGEVCECATICNRRGLHARAAAKFAKLAGQFDCDIEVKRNDVVVSAQSIMGLMMLAASPGTTIEVCAYGVEAEPAVGALVALIRRKFDED